MSRRARRLQSGPHKIQWVNHRGTHTSGYAPKGEQGEHPRFVFTGGAQITQFEGLECTHIDGGIPEKYVSNIRINLHGRDDTCGNTPTRPTYRDELSALQGGRTTRYALRTPRPR